jgi:N-acyl-phosphatidylethanolamine-hydrolysing phospholipase D
MASLPFFFDFSMVTTRLWAWRVAIVLLPLLGCLPPAAAQSNPYYDSRKAHHTPSGFRNNYVESVSQGLPALLRWQWEAWCQGRPFAPKAPTPTVEPDLAALQQYSTRFAQAPLSTKPAITWVGHATMLVQADGLNVLTDPVFSERAFAVQWMGPRRVQAPGVALDDLPPIDVVLISHNHYDHLDRDSVVRLNARARQQGHPILFLVPLGIKPWMQKLGIDAVQELDWWDRRTVAGVAFHFTPVQHWSARGVADQSETLWGGWAVLGPSTHWFFGGDSGYSQDFADIRKHFADRQTVALGGGFDIALVPIGAYEPHWFMHAQHIDPAEAVQVHRDLGTKRSVGIHWGTFSLADEALDQPPVDLMEARRAAGLDDDDFLVLKIGETLSLALRAPSHANSAKIPP